MDEATGRRLAGRVVREEIDRRGLSQGDLALATGLTRDTVWRVIHGKETVSDTTLRRVEGGLDLPRRLLDYVKRGDVEGITRIEMDSDLQRAIVDLIQEPEPAPPPAARPRRRRRA